MPPGQGVGGPIELMRTGEEVTSHTFLPDGPAFSYHKVISCFLVVHLDNGVLKASGWQGKRENIDATLSQHGCAQASGTFLGGPGAPFKIDSRRGQNRVPRGPKWRPEGLRGALGSQV